MQETWVLSLEKWSPNSVFLLGNPMDRGAWQATVYGVAKGSNMTEQLNNNNKNKSVSGDGITQIPINDYELENE